LNLLLFSIVAAATALGTEPGAPPAERPKSSRILILDLAPESEGEATANRIFAIDPSDDDPTVASLLERLEPLDRGDSASTPALITFLRSNGSQLARRTSNRWISRKGDSLYIYVLRPVNRKAKVDFAEDRRKSRIESDLITLVQVGQKISGMGVLGDEPRAVLASVSVSRYGLTKLRANFSITARLDSVATRIKDSAPDTLRTTLVTGPAEHLFLSADAALTQARQIKYVESTRTLEPNMKPTEFLIGFNYSVGDLYDDKENASIGSFLRGMYVGFLVEASKRPFNQVSAIVGLRRNIPWLDRYISFGTVSPFAGVVWLRNDEQDATDAAVRSRYGRRDFVSGLSLNLDKALGWLDK
jgi:hypothetical protein